MIEYGPAKELMDDPAHPYTKLLMDSVPRIGDKWVEDIALPDIETKEFGINFCKFAPRCPYATDECRKGMPELKDIGGERKVRCYHALTGKK